MRSNAAMAQGQLTDVTLTRDDMGFISKLVYEHRLSGLCRPFLQTSGALDTQGPNKGLYREFYSLRVVFGARWGPGWCRGRVKNRRFLVDPKSAGATRIF